MATSGVRLTRDDPEIHLIFRVGGTWLEALARYLMRSPLSLTRMRFAPEPGEVIYTRKNGHDRAEDQGADRLDSMEFLARVLVQIPEPRRHARKRRWADLIRRIYEVDPLVCRCGRAMRIIRFITEPRVIERILEHLRRTQARSRGSPAAPTPSPALA